MNIINTIFILAAAPNIILEHLCSKRNTILWRTLAESFETRKKGLGQMFRWWHIFGNFCPLPFIFNTFYAYGKISWMLCTEKYHPIVTQTSPILPQTDPFLPQTDTQPTPNWPLPNITFRSVFIFLYLMIICEGITLPRAKRVNLNSA